MALASVSVSWSLGWKHLSSVIASCFVLTFCLPANVYIVPFCRIAGALSIFSAWGCVPDIREILSLGSRAWIWIYDLCICISKIKQSSHWAGQWAVGTRVTEASSSNQGRCNLTWFMQIIWLHSIKSETTLDAGHTRTSKQAAKKWKNTKILRASHAMQLHLTQL